MKGIDIAHELVNLHNFMKYKSDHILQFRNV